MSGEEPFEGLGVSGSGSLNQAEGRLDTAGSPGGFGSGPAVGGSVEFGHHQANRGRYVDSILLQKAVCPIFTRGPFTGSEPLILEESR